MTVTSITSIMLPVHVSQSLSLSPPTASLPGFRQHRLLCSGRYHSFSFTDPSRILSGFVKDVNDGRAGIGENSDDTVPSLAPIMRRTA